MIVPASLSKWAHPPRSNTPRSSSSGPPGPCITPSTETCVVVVSFMVAVPFSIWSSFGSTGPRHRSHRSQQSPSGRSFHTLAEHGPARRRCHVHAIVPPLSLRGPVLTIRRFSHVAIEARDLLSTCSVGPRALLFLAACVRGRATSSLSPPSPSISDFGVPGRRGLAARLLLPALTPPHLGWHLVEVREDAS